MWQFFFEYIFLDDKNQEKKRLYHFLYVKIEILLREKKKCVIKRVNREG